MKPDYQAKLDALFAAVLGGPGRTSPSLRAKIAARDDVAAPLAAVRDAIFDRPSQVTDSDVDSLRATQSEDEIFEAIAAAALGAARLRLDAALAAVKAADS